MPFTFSHPAILLPFAKASPRWVSFTGLVVGSLTPDFEYFIRMKIQSTFSHSITGLFSFDLPLGILLSFVFHNIIRNPLYNNLPSSIGKRLLKYQSFQWNDYFKGHWVIVVASVILGAASHLFWDAFTHGHGYFINRILALTNSISFMGYSMPVYQFLQHLSSVVGGIAICIFILLLPVDRSIAGVGSKYYWPTLIMIALIIISIRVLMGFDQNIFGQLIGTAISAIVIALILTPLLGRKKYI